MHCKGCFQWFKDTNLKANHNLHPSPCLQLLAVFNGSKILIWKQITTVRSLDFLGLCCFQWFKDTNLKANHNASPITLIGDWAVFNGSKILIWKQITTQERHIIITNRCFQWFKDTNLKANHNKLGVRFCCYWLFSMVQRY